MGAREAVPEGKLMNDYWFVPPCDFVSGMKPADREALLALARIGEFAKGEFVFNAGDPGQNVYILESGRAKICQLSPEGKEIILWFCLPGEMFGMAEVPHGSAREVFAQVCTRSSVYSIPRETFNIFLSDHPDTALQVISLLSCRLRTIGHMLLNLAQDDVTSRIVKLLLRLSVPSMRNQDANMSLQIPLTHQEIADMVGASRQTVSTVLGELRREGALDVVKHRIHIHNGERLSAMLDGLDNARRV